MDSISTSLPIVIGCLALLTSLISTIISFDTFKLQRIHNVKSVKPIVQIGQWDYEDNLSVDLRNSGLGPAIVKEIIVLDGNDFEKNCVYDWLPKKLPNKMNYKEYWTAHKNFVVQPGQIIKLIEVPIDTLSNEELLEREKIRKIIAQLRVKVKYDDLYDNRMPIKEIKLNHFSRIDNEN